MHSSAFCERVKNEAVSSRHHAHTHIHYSGFYVSKLEKKTHPRYVGKIGGFASQLAWTGIANKAYVSSWWFFFKKIATGE